MVIAYRIIKCTDINLYVDKKMCTICTDRQTVDSNVKGRMVIAYWMIKCTDTNWYGDKKMCTVLYRWTDRREQCNRLYGYCLLDN